MAKFTHNNTKNISNGYNPFELNCSFNPKVSYKKNVNLQFKSKTANQLGTKLQILMFVCRKKF